MSRSPVRAGAKIAAAFIIAVALGSSPTRAEPDAVSGEPADSAAVRAVWLALDAAWNARDAERFSRLFTEETSLGFVKRGLWFDSRAAIRRQFEDQFPRTAPEFSHSTNVREIHEIAAEVIAVDGSVEILRNQAGNASPTVFRSFFLSAVMVNTAEGWRIRILRAFQLPAEDDADG